MNVIDRIVGLYAPHLCVGCNLPGSFLCSNCQKDISTAPERCYGCYSPSRNGRTCSQCRPASPLTSVNALVTYEGHAKAVIWQLKFNRAAAAADLIATLLAQRYAPLLAPDMLVVPVPTARRRVRSRGYDQSVLIAKALARRTECRYAPLLMRLGSQEQKGADRRQRKLQLQQAFRLKRPDLAQGARVLLVDDVLTTGASLEAAATVLRESGARAVGGLVFAAVDTGRV